MDYDKTDLPDAYARGRKLSPETAGLWMDAVAEFLAPDGKPAARGEAPLSILDLGSGTGRFTPLLAERFGAKVTGVEPSEKMRTQAVENAVHPHVTYLAGSAEAIPCDDASFDAAFLSMVLHHFRSVPDTCGELWRILRPCGYVFIRNSFRDRLDSVRYFDFFPSARHVSNAHMPDIDDLIGPFDRAGLRCVVHRVVPQQIDASLHDHYERMRLKASSAFVLISDDEFREGIEAMRTAAEAETQPMPIIEDIDFLVFQRCDEESGDV